MWECLLDPRRGLPQELTRGKAFLGLIKKAPIKRASTEGQAPLSGQAVILLSRQDQLGAMDRLGVFCQAQGLADLLRPACALWVTAQLHP